MLKSSGISLTHAMPYSLCSSIAMAINELANCKELQYLNSIYFERTQFQPIVKLVIHDIVSNRWMCCTSFF